MDKDFAERINPRNLGFSPKLVAIVGAIIGHDYGVRDHNQTMLATGNGHLVFGSLQIAVLAQFCQSQNSNFMRERWLGYIAGINGPSGGKVDKG